MRRLRRRILRGVALGSAVGALLGAAPARGQSYTNWPPEREWVAVSNHIAWCFRQLADRYEILGWDPRGLPQPCYVCPPQDYRAIVRAVSLLAANFVDARPAGGGSFDGWFATPIATNWWYDEDGGWTAAYVYPSDFPHWELGALLEYCGAGAGSGSNETRCVQWFGTNSLLDSWAVWTNRELMAHLPGVLAELRWTTNPANWSPALSGGWGRGGAYTSNGCDYATVVAAATANYRAEFGAWERAPCAYFTASACEEWYSVAMQRICADARTWKGRGLPCGADVYFATCPDPPVFDDNGDGVAWSERPVRQGQALLPAGDTNAAIRIGDESLALPAACEEPPMRHNSTTEARWRGYRAGGPLVLLRWDVAGGLSLAGPPGVPPAVALLPDTDRDDLADVGVDLEGFGPDTGTLAWMPAQREAYALLPLASPPPWYAGPATHAYLTGTPWLPYQYLSPNEEDRDGYGSAYSLNTRILEQKVVCDPTQEIKRVSVLRPRGQLVVFDFPWIESQSRFDPAGRPLGVHSNRTYVLRDPTPGVPDDGGYALLFASGVQHEYRDCALCGVSDLAGLQVRGVPGGTAPASGNSRPQSAADGRYEVAVTWERDQPVRLDYTSVRDPAAQIAVAATWSPSGTVLALHKSGGAAGIGKTDASVAGDTIAYGSGVTVKRAPADSPEPPQTVTLTTEVPQSGELVEEIVFDANAYPLSYTRTLGSSQATVGWQYAGGAGRYPNGFLRKAKVVRTDFADGGWEAWTYRDDTGWPATRTRPTAFGEMTTTFDYAPNADYDGGGAPPNTVERPRQAVDCVGGTEIGRTCYAYGGAAFSEIRRCVRAAADGAEPESVAVSIGWSDQGLPTYVRTPFREIDFAYAASPGRLQTTVASGPANGGGGDTRSETLNAFGYLEAEEERADGEPAFSAAVASDPFGRPLTIDLNDGSHTEVLEYDLYGPLRILEPDGSESTQDYDALGRRKTRAYLGRTLDAVYDPLGNPTQAAARGGADRVAESAGWDALGRLLWHTDRLGRTTMGYAPAEGGVRATVTPPGGGALVVEHWLDGALRSVGGPGATAPVAYRCELVDGAPAVREFRGGENAPEWTLTTFNLLGLPRTVEKSDGQGKRSTIDYDAAWRPCKTTDEDGVVRFQSWDERDELRDEGLSLSGGGAPDFAGDRLRTHTRAGLRHTWQDYPQTGSAQPRTLAEASAGGDGRSMSLSWAGHTASVRRSNFSAGGVYTVTNTLDGGRQELTCYEKWEPRRVERRENGVVRESLTLERDGLGGITRATRTADGASCSIDFVPDGARRVGEIRRSGVNGSVQIGYREGTDQIVSVTDPAAGTVTIDRAPNGEETRRSGATWTVDRECDALGRTTKLTTAAGVTEFLREAASGRVVEKRIDGRTAESYAYRADGLLDTVGGPDGEGYRILRGPGGDRTGLELFGAVTGAPRARAGRAGPVPPSQVRLEWDRGGRLAALEEGGLREERTYRPDGQLAARGIQGGGLVPDHTIDYSYADDGGDLSRVELTTAAGSRALTRGYADHRVALVQEGAFCVDYGGAAAVNAVAWRPRGETNAFLTCALERDAARGTITNLLYRIGSNTVAAFRYDYATNADRIARLTLADGSTWSYGYDGQHQLARATHCAADGTPVPGADYAYGYDGIGNAVRAGPVLPGDTNLSLYAFVPDADCFHVERVWSNLVQIAGRADADATVSVNLVRARRQGEWFCAVVPVSNAAGAVELPVTVAAVRYDPARKLDLVDETSGRLYVPQAVEAVAHSASGCLVADSRWVYGYDWAKRLVSAESRGLRTNLLLRFDYYPDGRRARKRVFELTGLQENLLRTHQFLYDGWNLIEEIVLNRQSAIINRKSYTWGLDLAGWASGRAGQEAGGIGGLLAVRVVSGAVTNLYLPIADAKGNIRHLVQGPGAAGSLLKPGPRGLGLPLVVPAPGVIVASYDYDPFGRLIGKSGPAADACPFRFSTKYLDEETGLLYYGHRFFDSRSCQWLTRDPLGEQGGLNLTAFCANDPVNQVDPLGLRGAENDYRRVDYPVGDLPAIAGEIEDHRKSEITKCEKRLLEINQRLEERYAQVERASIFDRLWIGREISALESEKYLVEEQLRALTDPRGTLFQLFVDAGNDPVTFAPLIGPATRGMYGAGGMIAALAERSEGWILTGRGTLVPRAVFGGTMGEIVAAKEPIVIGENMKRVQQFADDIGGHAYRPWQNDPFDYDLGMKRDTRWIEDMKRQGREIIDIGPDFKRRSLGRDPSGFYNMERFQTKDYYKYRKVFERTGKNSGGVPGLDF